MKKGKRILSSLLAIMLLVLLLPSTALAADDVYTVSLTKNDKITRSSLNGGQFEIWKVASPADVLMTGFTKDIGNSSIYTYSNLESNIILVTAENGLLQVNDLPEGEYYFKEIRAPGGYSLPSEEAAKTYFSLGKDEFIATANSNAYGTVSVKNENPYTLVNTYGPRLNNYVSVRFLKDNNGNRLGAGSHNYVSSFPRNSDGVFFLTTVLKIMRTDTPMIISLTI